MVSRTRSSVRGRRRGGAISVHESVHGERVSEQQEGNHREGHANSKEVGLRQMMRTIIDRLPPVHDQDGAHQEGHEHRPRSRSPLRDRHRSIVSSQMKDLQRSRVKPFNGQGSGYVAE